MKVLHVYRTYLPDTYGGMEQSIYQLCLATTRLGVENHIVYLSHEPRIKVFQRSEGRVYRLPMDLEIASTGMSSAMMRCFRKIAKRADLINYHFPWPFADAMHMLYASDRPAVITYHSDIIRQKTLEYFYRPLRRWFFARARAIVATSANYYATSPVLKRYSEKVSIIPIGLDETTYPAVSPERVDYYRKLVGDDFFLFIGVLRYYKGLHILLDAVKNSFLKVVIVGAGPSEKALKAQAVRCGISNVEFFGYLPDADKVALLSLCKAMVFPSHMRSEAFGVSLLEGAMFGKPLISCEIGTGSSYINRDGVTGKVVKSASPVSLCRAMLWMDANPEERQRMGKAARQRFEQLFTADHMAESYLELYSHLLKENQ
jgi:rhamnosyl/mannosyltransferase